MLNSRVIIKLSGYSPMHIDATAATKMRVASLNLNLSKDLIPLTNILYPHITVAASITKGENFPAKYESRNTAHETMYGLRFGFSSPPCS